MSNRQAEVESLAALIGSTNSQLKALDEQIVSSSTNLQQSNTNWNAQATLQKGIQDIAMAPGPESIPMPAPQGPLPVAEQAQPAPVMQPTPSTSPDTAVQLDRIEKKLDTFISQVDKLTTLDKKLNSFIERGLKNKVKQITLKLDDIKHTE